MVPKNGLEIIALVIRVLLGAWFALSGIGKIFVSGLDRFARDVANYQMLRPPLEIFVAYSVPWIEVFGGVFLMLGIFRKGTILTMTGLVLIFATAIGWAWQHHLDISCGCYGAAGKIGYWAKAIELAGYLIALAFLGWMESRPKVGKAS